MQTQMLGNSDLSITRVGYGAWAIGGTGWEYAWGPQKDDDSIAAIRRSLDLGVNWIDTAAVYGLGHSEEVVARALADWPGKRPSVFTKCGLVWDERGRLSRKFSAATVRQECEASLARLRVETIDLYRSTGRRRTTQNWRRGGQNWPCSNARAKCAGPVFRTSAWSRWSALGR
jgi:aryl-alcohol dehydrogenase-like predicted oxidoreductase